MKKDTLVPLIRKLYKLLSGKTVPSLPLDIKQCTIDLIKECERDEEILEILLNLGADESFPELVCKSDTDLLRAACAKNFVGTLIFLARRCSVEVLDSSGCVDDALSNGRSEISRFLSDYRTIAETRNKFQRLEANSVEYMYLKTDEEDRNGNTPLLTALGKIYWKMDIGLIKSLAEQGNVERPNFFKFTPLLRAIENRSYESVKLLARHGAVLQLNSKLSFKYPLKFFEKSPIDIGYAIPCAILCFLLQHNVVQPGPIVAQRQGLKLVSYEKPFELYKAYSGILRLLLLAGYKLPTMSRLTRAWPEQQYSVNQDWLDIYRLVTNKDTNVVTLRRLSLLTVRSSLGPYIKDKVEQLLIPAELKCALMLPELKTFNFVGEHVHH